MNIEQHQKAAMAVMGIFLLASIAGNLYLYRQLKNARQYPFTQGNQTVSSITTSNDYGFQNETVTFFDGKKYRTYSTSTPLTKNDIRRIREEIKREFIQMHEFFRKQDALFRSLLYF